MDATRDALERALLDRPDDVATHSAYADYLSENDDPRGDYIRLQLALEDRTQPTARIRQMDQASYELRRQHEAEWLGPLYPFVNPPRANRSVAEPVAPNVEVTFKRGWLHALHIGELTDEIVRTVAGVPVRGLLQELSVLERRGVPATVELRDVHQEPQYLYPSLRPWIEAGVGVALRRLTFGAVYGYLVGQDSFPGETVRFLESAPRLEALEGYVGAVDAATLLALPLTRLEIMRLAVGAGDDTAVGHICNPVRLPLLRTLELVTYDGRPAIGEPSDVTEFFRSLRSTRLTELKLRLPDLGDDGVRLLCESGLLCQLRALDLSNCNVTDDGAERLAAHPDLGRLEALELADNSISPIGLDALARAGFRISRRQNLGPGPGEGFADDEIPF